MTSMVIRAALVLVAAAGLAVASVVVFGDPPGQRDLERALESPYGLAGLFALSAMTTAALIFPVPGMTLTIIGATIAPPVVIGLVAGAGQATGELTGYLAGRSGDHLVKARLSSSRLAGWMSRFGAPSVFVLALVPNPAFDVAGVLAGALRMSVLAFLLAAAAGKVLRNVLIALLVSHGHNLLVASDGFR